MRASEIPRICVQCGGGFAVRDTPRDLLGPPESPSLCPDCAPPTRSRLVAKRFGQALLAIAAFAVPFGALVYDWLGDGFEPSTPPVQIRAPEPLPLPTYNTEPNAPARPLDPGSWVTNPDYPARALAENREGTVAFTLAVDATGRVSRCTVTASSGHTDLDAATCEHIADRARFAPATDQDGRAIASDYANRVTWKIDE